MCISTPIRFDNIDIVYDEEEILLNAVIHDSDNQNIDLKFKNVDLAKVTPSLKNLKLGGVVNGNLNINLLI